MAFAKAIFFSAITCVLVSVASAAPTAPAVPVLYGGGSSMAAAAYLGPDWVNVNPQTGTVGTAQRLSTTAASLNGTSTPYGNSVSKTSLFGEWVVGSRTVANPAIQYCQTSSGAARNILTGLAGSDPWISCGDFSTGLPFGFGTPPLAAIPGQPAISVNPGSATTAAQAEAGDVDVNFAASDMPMPVVQYNAFFSAGDTGVTRSSVHTQPVQFPALAASIAILYNATDTGLGNTSHLVLTESQVCQIFAGQITNWIQLGAPNSLPITVVYREEANGPSFYFSNHLNAVCGTAQGQSVPNLFVTSNVFLQADPALTSGAPFAVAPVPALGNWGVVAAVLSTPGAISYGELADALARAAGMSGSLDYANIKLANDMPAYITYLPASPSCNPASGPASKTCKATKHAAIKYKVMDPLLNLPKTFAVNAYADETLAGFLPGNDTTNGRPIVQTVSAVIGSSLPVAGCTLFVHPDDVATSLTTSRAPYDYVQYPMVALSYLMGYEAGNLNATPYLRSLLSYPYETLKAKTIGTKTGYAQLKPTLMTSDAVVGAIYTRPAAADIGPEITACINE